jgi:hypothetical protein
MNRYRSTLRPVSFATLPADLRWDYVEAPANVDRRDIPRSEHRYGVISTDRPLTADEMYHFDLIPA